MARLKERDDWFDLWFEDRKSMLGCMVRNMVADLDAGYNYFGSSITKQKATIEAYHAETDAQIDQFKGMSEDEVNRWCFYDLKKRGAIE